MHTHLAMYIVKNLNVAIAKANHVPAVHIADIFLQFSMLCKELEYI